MTTVDRVDDKHAIELQEQTHGLEAQDGKQDGDVGQKVIGDERVQVTEQEVSRVAGRYRRDFDDIECNAAQKDG